jgi:hypothetical protein
MKKQSLKKEESRGIGKSKRANKRVAVVLNYDPSFFLKE